MYLQILRRQCCLKQTHAFAWWSLGSDVEGSLVIVTVAYSIRSLAFVPQFVFVFWTLPVWKWVSEDGVGGGIGEAGTCCSRGARNSLRYKTGARPLPDLNGQVGFQHFLFWGSSSLLPFGNGEYLGVFEKIKKTHLLCLKGSLDLRQLQTQLSPDVKRKPFTNKFRLCSLSITNFQNIFVDAALIVVQVVLRDWK